MKALTTIIAAALAAAAFGCGDAGPTEEEQKAAAAEAKAERIAEDCETQLRDFVTQLQELNGRLGVGMSLAQYERALQGIGSAYGLIDIRDVDGACLDEVGVPSETAYQEYVKAADLWSACLYGCPGLSRELNVYWDKAESLITGAAQGLADLTAGETPTEEGAPLDPETTSAA